MQAMVAAVFSRLRHLSPEQRLADLNLSSTVSLSDSSLQAEAEAAIGLGVRMSAPDPRGAHIPAAAGSDGMETDAKREEPEQEASVEDEGERLSGLWLTRRRRELILVTLRTDNVEVLPFGIASIQELLRVLISLLNPHDQQHTDSMRLMALGLLNIAFEVGGRSIGNFPSLRLMVADHLCKHLFQVCPSPLPVSHLDRTFSFSDLPSLLDPTTSSFCPRPSA
jgi:brefeldin A-resistance guanine nucleotide exchange factor 1